MHRPCTVQCLAALAPHRWHTRQQEAGSRCGWRIASTRPRALPFAHLRIPRAPAASKPLDEQPSRASERPMHSPSFAALRGEITSGERAGARQYGINRIWRLRGCSGQGVGAGPFGLWSSLGWILAKPTSEHAQVTILRSLGTRTRVPSTVVRVEPPQRPQLAVGGSMCGCGTVYMADRPSLFTGASVMHCHQGGHVGVARGVGAGLGKAMGLGGRADLRRDRPKRQARRRSKGLVHALLTHPGQHVYAPIRCGGNKGGVIAHGTTLDAPTKHVEVFPVSRHRQSPDF